MCLEDDAPGETSWVVPSGSVLQDPLETES